MQLKFNPFDFDCNITKSNHFENYTAANLECLACNYYLPNDFAMLNTDSTSKKLSILSLNIRSIANKFDSFSNLLNTLKRPFSAISLTETWLNDINSENFNLPNFDFVCSNRVNKKGGGVGFFISNNLNYKIQSDLNTKKDGIIETLFIAINSTSSKNIILGSIYRPPNGDFEMFENTLNTILTKVDKTKKVTYSGCQKYESSPIVKTHYEVRLYPEFLNTQTCTFGLQICTLSTRTCTFCSTIASDFSTLTFLAHLLTTY